MESKQKRPGSENYLRISTWSMGTLRGKEVELASEMKKFKLDMLGIGKVKKIGNGEMNLQDEYKLLYSGVAYGEFAKEKLGITMPPPPLHSVIWKTGSQYPLE